MAQFDAVPSHVPAVPHPMQFAQSVHVAHDVMTGVPVHVGPFEKTWGGGGGAAAVVPQQIRASPTVQSLSDEHDCGHVAWQMLLQQSCPCGFPAQSAEVAHAVGHGAYIGLRHRPDAVTDGSMFLAVVQQT